MTPIWTAVSHRTSWPRVAPRQQQVERDEDGAGRGERVATLSVQVPFVVSRKSPDPGDADRAPEAAADALAQERGAEDRHPAPTLSPVRKPVFEALV